MAWVCWLLLLCYGCWLNDLWYRFADGGCSILLVLFASLVLLEVVCTLIVLFYSMLVL